MVALRHVWLWMLIGWLLVAGIVLASVIPDVRIAVLSSGMNDKMLARRPEGILRKGRSRIHQGTPEGSAPPPRP